jgi:Pyruvate/2-oxoacid:ferredoxin oxidoreductase delta subunit
MLRISVQSRKKVNVEISMDQVTKEVDSFYKDLGKKAKIKGFRPGKVPRYILERHFKDYVKAEVVQKLIQDTYPTALSESNLHPVSNPMIDPGDLESGKPFQYSATIEVKPEIKLEGYLGLTIEGKKEEVKPPTDTIIKSNMLNLEYRQGPEMPPLQYGFPDSHFICFPYETRRTGIYAAGTVRRPSDIPSSEEDGRGAALKAIQCVELTARGMSVHPRSGDIGYPELFMQRCTQCKRCTEECPFGMYDEDEKHNPLSHPTRCRRCGICIGSVS